MKLFAIEVSSTSDLKENIYIFEIKVEQFVIFIIQMRIFPSEIIYTEITKPFSYIFLIRKKYNVSY